MTIDMKILAGATVDAIDADIRNGEPIEIVKNHYSAAYAQISQDKHKRLYRELSLLVHPDKLPSSYPSLHAYLLEKECNALLFRELEPFNPDREKSASDDYKELGQLLNNYFNKYEAYPEPLQTLVYLSAAVVNMLLILSFIVAVTATGVLFVLDTLIIMLAEGIEMSLLNFISDNLYEKELKDYRKTACKISYCNTQRDIFLHNFQGDISEYTDDQVIEIIVNQRCSEKQPNSDEPTHDEALLEQVKAEIQNEIEDETISLDIRTKFMLLKSAQGKSSVSTLKLAGQCILMPIALIFSVGIALCEYIATAILLAGFFFAVVSFVGKCATTLLINLPLYMIDAGKALFGERGKVGEEANVHSRHIPASGYPLRLLMGSSYAKEPKETMESAPELGRVAEWLGTRNWNSLARTCQPFLSFLFSSSGHSKKRQEAFGQFTEDRANNLPK